MNAFEYAMRMEQEAEKSYRQMAEESNDNTIRKVLLMLAGEEAKHYKVFEKMAKNQSALKDIESFDSGVTARDIFTEIKAENKRYSFNSDQVEFYEKAAKVEDKAYKFYLEKAKEATDPDVKKSFELIAEEEKKHQELMENLASFVASPDTWLESAEFYKVTEEL